jgi:hypothetical protein
MREELGFWGFIGFLSVATAFAAFVLMSPDGQTDVLNTVGKRATALVSDDSPPTSEDQKNMERGSSLALAAMGLGFTGLLVLLFVYGIRRLQRHGRRF